MYWVTWIGAAAFAARHGSRLPTRREMIRQTRRGDLAATNTDYQVGDVTPVDEPGRDAGDIHHLVGNLQVWCGDGPSPAQACEGAMARWLHGAAWNTPSTPAEIHRPRCRHLTGCSRGVGIRLIRDREAAPVSARRLAVLLGDWMQGLEDRGKPLAVLDGQLIEALEAARSSQADVGFGTHVGTGTGETGLSQLQDLVVGDDDPGDAYLHAGNLSQDSDR